MVKKIVPWIKHFLEVITTESSKYYVWPQTAVLRGLSWPASRLTGLHTATAPKHSLCFSVQFPSNLVMCIDIHLQNRHVSIYWLWLLLDISAVSVVTVIIVICDMPWHEFSLRERVYSETRLIFRIKFQGRPVSNPSTIRRRAKQF